MNNIAEGFERKTFRDFARFLDLAKGSCGEVRSMLYVAQDLGYISVNRNLVTNTTGKTTSLNFLRPPSFS